MDVRINGKLYKSIEKLTKEKLEHLLQLAKIDLSNYKNASKNYPEDRMTKFGIPMLTKLENVIDEIQSLIK